jgi:hypothetical protein
MDQNKLAASITADAVKRIQELKGQHKFTDEQIAALTKSWTDASKDLAKATSTQSERATQNRVNPYG